MQTAMQCLDAGWPVAVFSDAAPSVTQLTVGASYWRHAPLFPPLTRPGQGTSDQQQVSIVLLCAGGDWRLTSIHGPGHN